MAIHNSDPTGGPVDFKVHARDYAKVIGMLKWGAIASFIIAFAVMIILTV